LANAYNIVDGFNGISSMVGIIALLALAFVSFSLGDQVIVNLSLLMLGSILGFFFSNYPKGKIFLGDGGAYLIGSWVGVLSIWICDRHQEVSPWFALLINAYPIAETIFTIYRRTVQKNKNAFQPDGIHLIPSFIAAFYYSTILGTLFMRTREQLLFFGCCRRFLLSLQYYLGILLFCYSAFAYFSSFLNCGPIKKSLISKFLGGFAHREKYRVVRC
jgi:UDP-N-acetylmuramyl pentapeptide phosphotransferase/UDP-N-acetylglucosamine-1-phosphate transferase